MHLVIYWDLRSLIGEMRMFCFNLKFLILNYNSDFLVNLLPIICKNKKKKLFIKIVYSFTLAVALYVTNWFSHPIKMMLS